MVFVVIPLLVRRFSSSVLHAMQDPLQAGLELFCDGEWQPRPPGSCLITFGWCAQIRSNDRSAPHTATMLPCKLAMQENHASSPACMRQALQAGQQLAAVALL